MKSFIKHIIFKVGIKIFWGLGKVLKKKHIIYVAKFIGNLLYLLPWSRKYIALENLKIAFENQYTYNEIKKILKKFIIEVILIILETAFIIKQQEKLNPWALAEGLNYLDNALKKGNGVIALSGHIGNIPLMLAWLAEKGYPVAVLFKEGKYLPKGFLFDLISSYKIHPIPFHNDRDVPKEIIKALNKNMIVFILADQARPGVYAKFFGRYVQCQKGAFVIAQRKGSPVVPVFIVREKDGHKIKIFEQIEMEDSNSFNPTTKMIENYNSILENLIKHYPEQYYWFHRRFKKMRS